MVGVAERGRATSRRPKRGADGGLRGARARRADLLETDAMLLECVAFRLAADCASRRSALPLTLLLDGMVPDNRRAIQHY